MSLPIFPWPGVKRRLIKHLYAHFPAHNTYVAASAGGVAALLMRPVPAQLEALNDVNSDLVTLYRCVRYHLEELVRMFSLSLVSRQMFEWAAMERPES
ncbi:MAG: DNA adenine methylase [Stenotrophomonas sp.]|uniref:DNA adenine methylase n=1 Tax=Stenotrophomonas sp. TaxID=69392 RepID=UPI003D6CCC51